MIRTRGRRHLGALTVLALLAAAPRAQIETSDQDDELRITVRSEWPVGVSRGYAPLEVEIENLDEGLGCLVDLEISNDHWRYGSVRIFDRVSLEAGSKQRRELLLPFGTPVSSTWRVEARSSRADRVDFHFAFGGPPNSNGREFFVLVVEPPGTIPRDTLPWREVLKTGDLEPQHQFRSAAAPGPQPNVQIARCAFDALPARHEAYSSLDTVVLDTSAAGLPNEAALAPLLTWARQGGTLVLVGAHTDTRAHPALAPWLEERFLLRGEGDSAAYVFAQGRLILSASAQLFGDPFANELIRDKFLRPSAWVPSAYGSAESEATLSIPGLEELPFEGLTFFLIVFAALVGPVNFALLRKWGRPHLTLLTIPALSLVTCVGLLGYAFLSQGIDVKAAVRTWTVLDQRTHRADTAEVRLFWAGLAPGPGLRPGPGTGCYPVPTRGAEELASFRFRRGSDYRPDYRVDFTEGMLLAGGYLPTRTPTRQVLLGETSARGRLAFQREGERWSVHNGLGAALDELHVRDESGAYWRLAAPLASDGRVALERADIDRTQARLAELNDGVRPFGAVDRLPLGTYAAVLPTSPFRDDCGVSMNDLDAQHLVAGVVAAGELRP